MSVSKKYKPETNWNQTAFEELKASWSPERIAEDEKTLQEIFKLAADSPLLAEELEWAKRHGVKFFIDHTAVNCGGYYWAGSGVVAIPLNGIDSARHRVQTLAHEIRHAWQDYQRLLSWSDRTPDRGNFAEGFIKQALVEADALAYGRRAVLEFEAARFKKRGKRIPAFLQAFLVDENADLGRHFLSWFKVSSHPESYGDFFSKQYGQKWRVYDGDLPERKFEHWPVEPEIAGIDIYNIRDVLRLGVNFSGTKNYLAALQSDILPKQILRPSLADTFWGAANKDQRKLTAGLRKAHLKKKLAARSVPKHHLS